MLCFEKLNAIKGFDMWNPVNAHQNNYAWSMAEMGDYIYVGTCRNMFTSMLSLAKRPLLGQVQTTGLDNNAEIWRYKKDGTQGWQRVFKTHPYDKSFGFRAMTVHESKYSTALYAATIGERVYIYKSIDGVTWKKLRTPQVVGGSSRSFASLNGRLYVSTLQEGIGGKNSYLYSSADPEFEPFKLVMDPHHPYFQKDKNPMGGIDALEVFNHKLYLGVSGENGAEVWRSMEGQPAMNKWIKVGDAGFGDGMNQEIMSMGTFKNHLYVALTKKFPLAFFAPLGFDLVRFDRCDCWELIVGGRPMKPTHPKTGERTTSLSGFKSGFNSPFNVYGWQLLAYQDKLILTTFDDSVNMKLMRDVFIQRKEGLIQRIGQEKYQQLVCLYGEIICLLEKYQYPKGFDLYVSKDGIHFRPEVLSGLNNPYSYGGRTLLVSQEDELYVGTANPYEGCDVYRGEIIGCQPYFTDGQLQSYFEQLEALTCELQCLYPDLIRLLSELFVTSKK